MLNTNPKNRELKAKKEAYVKELPGMQQIIQDVQGQYTVFFYNSLKTKQKNFLYESHYTLGGGGSAPVIVVTFSLTIFKN